MAGIDTSMYANLTPPAAIDPLGSMNKALAYRNLQSEGQLHNIQAQQASQQYNDSLAMRNAQDNATTVNPDGSVSSDQNKMLTELGKTAPHLIPQAKATQMQQQQAQAEFQQKQMQDHATIAAQTFAKVNDQSSLDQAKVTATQLGYDTSHWPQKYAGNEDWVKTQAKNAAYAALNPNQRIEAQQKEVEGENKRQQLAIDSKKLDIERFKTFGNPVSSGDTKGGAPKIDPTIDPATLVRTHVAPDSQKKVYEEIDAAQTTAKNAPKILQSYDNAVAKLKSGIYTPEQFNQDIGAMQVNLGPTFKDVEGTVRQAAMDNVFNHVTPNNLDGKIKNKLGQDGYDIKRQALVNYLTSKSAAPTAKGAGGLDLSQFNSTRIDPSVLENPNKKLSSSNKIYAEGTTAKTKGGVAVVFKGGSWVPQ